MREDGFLSDALMEEVGRFHRACNFFILSQSGESSDIIWNLFHGDFDMEGKGMIGNHLHSYKIVKEVLIRKADTIFICIK